MRSKIILSLLPVFLFFFTSEAAIFIPETNNSQSQKVSSTIVEVPTTKSKGEKKVKRIKKEKADKVDNFAKWGFISAVAGFVSLFFLPFLSFALLPVGVGLSIAGLSASVKNKTRGKGLAIAGLAVGSAGILLILFAVVLVLTLFTSWGA